MNSYSVYNRAERSRDDDAAVREAETMRDSLPSDEISIQSDKRLSLRWMVQLQVAPVIKKKKKTLDPVLKELAKPKLPVKEKKIAKPRPVKPPLKPRPQQKRRRRVLIGMPKSRKARLPTDTSKLLALVQRAAEFDVVESLFEFAGGFVPPAPSTEGNADDDLFGHPEVSVP
jgi:hypothetical protein